MAEATHLVEMRDISKRFGGVRALQDVDFAVGRGEVVGLVGDNGAGKSTLIKILAGVYPPDKGEIVFEGRSVRFANPQEAKAHGIETVFQELALVETLDVVGNIFLGRERTRGPFLDRARMRGEARALLQELDAHVDSLHAWVRELSGGQRQVVAIARALHARPKLVILDEPTAALAVPEARKVLRLIRRLREGRVAVVFISHTLQHVLEVADRIVVLRKGRKVGDLPTEEADLERIVKLIVGEG